MTLHNSVCHTQNAEVDWVTDEAVKVDLPEPHCPILTHIVYSLLDLVDPPQVRHGTSAVCYHDDGICLPTASSNSSTIPQVPPESQRRREAIQWQDHSADSAKSS